VYEDDAFVALAKSFVVETAKAGIIIFEDDASFGCFGLCQKTIIPSMLLGQHFYP